MQAETAYNVIQALPEKELARLYTMLSVQPIHATVKPKRKNKKNDPLENWTVESVTEKLLATSFRRK
jgi:hypothetical protein